MASLLSDNHFKVFNDEGEVLIGKAFHDFSVVSVQVSGFSTFGVKLIDFLQAPWLAGVG